MAFNWPVRSINNREHPTGANAEKMAEVYLKDQGLRLLQRNFCCKQGEIDLIMEDKEVLVFVEVRFRKSDIYGSAVETVTAAKQRKLTAAAQHYLLRNKTAADRPLRFDVIGLMPESNTRSTQAGYEYTWIKNAFNEI